MDKLEFVDNVYRKKEHNYHNAFSSSSQKKAVEILCRLHKLTEIYSIYPERLAYISIGGSNGAELLHILQQSPIKYGILIEHNNTAANQAVADFTLLQADNKIKNKSLIVKIGDAVELLNEVIDLLEKLKSDNKIDGIVVSAMAVIHELYTRSQQFHLIEYVAKLANKWETFILFAREPCKQINWPEKVTIEFPTICSSSLSSLAKHINNNFSQSFGDGRSRWISPHSLELNSDLAVEMLHKIFYLQDFQHEMEERLTTIDPIVFASEIQYYIKLTDVNVERYNTDSFIAHYNNYKVKASAGGKLLCKPLCFFWVTAIKIPDRSVELLNNYPIQDSKWVIDSKINMLEKERENYKRIIDNYRTYRMNYLSLLSVRKIKGISLNSNVFTFDSDGLFCGINPNVVYLDGDNSLLEGVVTMTNHLINLIHTISEQWLSHPILLEIANQQIETMSQKLFGLIDDRGYSLHDKREINILISMLFRPELKKLRATSIQSSDEKFVNYKIYWDDHDLKFSKYNEDFIKKSGSLLERIYLCDDVITCVIDEWFITAIAYLSQVSNMSNYHMYVTEINNKDDISRSISDFGIYTYENNDGKESHYVLDAPIDVNKNSRELCIVLHAAATKKFDDIFISTIGNCHKRVDLLKSSSLYSDLQLEISSSRGKINDLFKGNILLRNLIPINNDINFSSAKKGFVRKHETEYAKIVSGYINLKYNGMPSAIIYVGDTYKNDGGVIRNLQKLGYTVYGFICDTSLAEKYVNENGKSVFVPFWFNDILFSNNWVDLVQFTKAVFGLIGSNPVAIFDIDQTLWAAKGINEKPIKSTRISAIYQLMGEIVDKEHQEYAYRMDKARDTYQLLCDSSYIEMTLDNEDYKSIIAIIIALDLQRYTRKPLSSEEDLEFNLSQYKARYKGSDGILHLLTEAENAAMSKKFREFAEKRINGDKLRDMLYSLRENILDQKPAPFTEFRAKEFENAYEMALNTLERNKLENILTINRTTWDFAQFLLNNNIPLMALSDRPDEATYIDYNKSLLNVDMLIHGYPILSLL
ncbi:MAG: hypothetical protein HQM06_12720 [Magnetococcales bacterium]|nr:hypothetical protein [Magnetococcales bacterium]